VVEEIKDNSHDKDYLHNPHGKARNGCNPRGEIIAVVTISVFHPVISPGIVSKPEIVSAAALQINRKTSRFLSTSRNLSGSIRISTKIARRQSVIRMSIGIPLRNYHFCLGVSRTNGFFSSSFVTSKRYWQYMEGIILPTNTYKYL
jgi:hypothetical protein